MAEAISSEQRPVDWHTRGGERAILVTGIHGAGCTIVGTDDARAAIWRQAPANDESGCGPSQNLTAPDGAAVGDRRDEWRSGGAEVVQDPLQQKAAHALDRWQRGVPFGRGGRNMSKPGRRGKCSAQGQGGAQRPTPFVPPPSCPRDRPARCPGAVFCSRHAAMQNGRNLGVASFLRWPSWAEIVEDGVCVCIAEMHRPRLRCRGRLAASRVRAASKRKQAAASSSKQQQAARRHRTSRGRNHRRFRGGRSSGRGGPLRHTRLPGGFWHWLPGDSSSAARRPYPVALPRLAEVDGLVDFPLACYHIAPRSLPFFVDGDSVPLPFQLLTRAGC